MIVLAADHVGLGVVKHLTQRRHRIDLLVLDPGDRGGRNAEIRESYLTEQPAGEVMVEARPQLKGRRPRLGVLAWWPHLLKGAVLEEPQLGWLNLHPSYLPYNRGKHPNFWCLVEGTPCGASLQFVDSGVDTGPVVARAELPLTWEDTGQTVYERCRELALKLFRDNVDALLAGQRVGEPQTPNEGTLHRAAELDLASEIELDRSYTARDLLNRIRARTFPPHPGAHFSEGGHRYSVEVRIREVE